MILIFPTFYYLFNYLYVNYAIKSNNYSVHMDYIEDFSTKETKLKRSSPTSSTLYYAHLKEHGKVKISRDYYTYLNKNDSVYVVVINGFFKNTYNTSPIYPTQNYIYNN